MITPGKVVHELFVFLEFNNVYMLGGEACRLREGYCQMD